MKNIFKPTDSRVWEELAGHRNSLEGFRLVDQFKLHQHRFDSMHARAAGLILDYSKNLVTDETLVLLVKAAESIGLQDKIEALFRGDKLNITEQRPALHTALRDFTGTAPFTTEVVAVLSRMGELVKAISGGQWQGATGNRISDVVNIGIGGSHLGPMMVTDALTAYRQGQVRCHFVSNIDSTDILAVLQTLRAESTLFVVSSKSFSTLETLQNAAAARSWLQRGIGPDGDVAGHFLAVTASPDKAHEFGIPRENILPMWDWVGGRYSLWSAIGITAALSIGIDNFNRLRKGAAAMDSHFREAPFNSNLPVLLALLEIWYINYWGAESHAVLPYNHHLRYLPEFLQQLEMESNGKSVSLDHREVDYPTASVLWGTVETNGQHSFHQLLHQGTRLIPVDFIVALKPDSEGDTHHPYLFANCLAQANALMTGKSIDVIRQELMSEAVSDETLQQMLQHRQMPGNRPSNTILMETLGPETLGALIALYEHKVYVQSVIWNINPFDQWGVELGKVISNQVYDRLTDQNTEIQFDSSTEGLIDLYKKSR
jgi:glucose-6-phosphate isomerase